VTHQSGGGTIRAGAALLTPADPRWYSRLSNADIHAPCGRCPAPNRARDRVQCVRYDAHRCNTWTSPVQAGDGSVNVVTAMANQAAPTMLLSCTALV